MNGHIGEFIINPSRRAAGVLFIINAFVFTSWAVRLPEIKSVLNIDDQRLGMALLASPLGVILFSIPTALLIKIFGLGRIVAGSAILVSFISICFPFVTSYYQLIIVLLIFGMSHGAFDIAINRYVTHIESEQGTSIMSISHGFWSMAAMLGFFVGGILYGHGISFINSSLLILIVNCVLMYMIWNIIVHLRISDEKATTFSLPKGELLFLSTFVFIIFMFEGALADWSAIFYKENLQAPLHLIGIGFAAFSGAMAVARFGGDVIIEKFNSKQVMYVSSSVISLALFAFYLSDSFVFSTFLLFIMGVFCSVLVPIVFRAAARTQEVSPSIGIATVSSIGYGGFLLGPPLVGMISHNFGLHNAFLFLAIALSFGFVMSYFRH